MNTRILVFLSLLVGMGAVLHQVAPPMLLGMKPDLLLVMVFLGIILFPEKKYVLLVAIVGGVIAALTTTFPMGQIPNVIDKFIAAFAFYGLFKLAPKNLFANYSKSLVLAFIGTITAIGIIISGTVFLLAALLLAGLPDTFTSLFIGVVIPATIMGTIAMVIIFPIAQQIIRRTKLTVNA
ncbi:tryptophan transporter [Ferdinandcohnia quinoae]|uniref:Tryptophan transporter n=1 Tax=Fredinandcohnia quinoae TaxID=2918902 RepID=A0AAW5E1L0_9BACI|nr:tryptophan transporter [Fredinandcohnia sp. SECRCQ15]MCH1626807.1 tryptophan transporter [Fredinandcohnia sp. SECRCQ15]